MRIPATADIPREKLTKYLLVPRPWDDKSKFLARAGFTAENPTALEHEIRRAAMTSEAVEDRSNDYGTFYRVVGELNGPSGRPLPVTMIWLQWKVDDTIHFVTLKPRKVKS